MNHKLQEIADSFREKGAMLSDLEAEDIVSYCKRKMEVAKVRNKEEYLPLLYRDEVKNYIFRRAVNATTTLRFMGEEAVLNV